MSFYERSQPEYVLAMHDYLPDQRNATCLAFRAGQVIRVLNRDPSGWWDGELDIYQSLDRSVPFLSLFFLLVGNRTYVLYVIIAKANTTFSIPFTYLHQFHH